MISWLEMQQVNNVNSYNMMIMQIVDLEFAFILGSWLSRNGFASSLPPLLLLLILNVFIYQGFH